MRTRDAIALISVVCLWSVPAYADVIWPALFLEGRLLTIPVIAAGLFIEWLFLVFGLGLTAKKAAVVDVVMNAVSTLVGMLAIPLAGLVWEFFPGLLMFKMLNIGTFNPLTWAFTYVAAVAITACIEVIVAKRIFKLIKSRRELLVVLAANAASVGVAFASLFVFPPR